jgi:endoglucanase
VKSLSEKQLPPDWAVMEADGSLRASTQGADGKPRFGFDAIRIPIRHAESCVAEDRDFAGALASRLNADHSAVSTNAVGWVARAASDAAADHPDEAGRALSRAGGERRSHPSYYGDAWEALGRYMLLDNRLGGCPPSVEVR